MFGESHAFVFFPSQLKSRTCKDYKRGVTVESLFKSVSAAEESAGPCEQMELGVRIDFDSKGIV